MPLLDVEARYIFAVTEVMVLQPLESETVILEDAHVNEFSLRVILFPPFNDRLETVGAALPTVTEVLAVSAITIMANAVNPPRRIRKAANVSLFRNLEEILCI